MNRHTEQTTFFQTLGALAAFMLWTAAICYVDVWPIGPEGSAVGFAALNGAFHQFTGVHSVVCHYGLAGAVPCSRWLCLWAAGPETAAAAEAFAAGRSGHTGAGGLLSARYRDVSAV